LRWYTIVRFGMHQKFLTSKNPVLADGDFMGVFASSDRGCCEVLLVSLAQEGIDRGEKVLIDQSVLREFSHNGFLCDSNPVTPFVLGKSPVVFFAQERERSLEEGYSGIRYLASSDTFFSSDPGVDLEQQRKLLLGMLMGGGAGIAVFYNDIQHVTFAELSRHPRVLHSGVVKTNPLFVLPERAVEYGSSLDAYLDRQTRSQGVRFQKGETFPLGVPDMLESIIESMGVGVVVGDPYGNMVLFNTAAQRMVGLPPSPLPYPERIRRFGNYLPDAKTPYPYELLPFSRATRGEDFENEVVFIKNEKNTRGSWISGSGRGVRDAHGTLLGGVVVLRDVTEEYITQKEKEDLELTLLQTQKMDSLGMLAGGIAHDFNNLLVGVLGNASILIQQELVQEQGKVRLKQIEDSALQLTDLTKQLLMYAGLSPRKTMKQISVGSVIDSMRGIFDTSISKKVSLLWDIRDANVWISGDEVQIRQVLLNLITNASDAHKGTSGSIQVTLYEQDVSSETLKKAIFSACERDRGRYAVIEIQDTGAGISDEAMEKIFDPFFSTKGMGRGLGLSAVLGIVKNHKGALEVHSEIGIGTRFRIFLPAVDHQEISPDVQESGNVALNLTGKVLVIDDEPMVVEVAEAILRDAGFDVIVAESGNQGLAKFAEYNSVIVCVIIDMTMPDIGGDEVYKKIRSISKDVPLVISSGFSKDLCKGFYEGDERSRFLEKPYPAQVLLEYVRESVGDAV
jgi:signal transduction histidine kinase/CheY-like chemotaxis protein